MPTLPTGTVTFLFTDIEGSTRLLQELGDRYTQLLADYRQLLWTAAQKAAGREVDTQGDSVFIAFPRAKDALLAAILAQRAIAAHDWPNDAKVRVRMGLHTGEPLASDTGYVGMDVHRAARICAAGHGGQILLSQTTQDLVEDDLPEGVSLRDLGQHRLKDLSQPQHLFQVMAVDLPADFPPLKSLNVLPNNLPIQLTSFIGREREKGEVKRLLASTRLLTLTGSGGAGKTRIALQVAAEVLEEFLEGAWLVELAPLSDPALVPQTVVSAMSVVEQPGRPILATLTDHVQQKHLLLVLDNCEHVVATCARLAETLLRACPHLQILATSREALGIAGETAWRVPSLSLPDPRHVPSLERLTDYEAVRLFVERAAASQPRFVVTNRTAASVVQVCHRLDGIPLAIELAAARVKVLTVEQIAARLDDRFRLLTSGSRTALPRHQTLRAAMDWSHALLSVKERTMLRRLSVFAGGCTLEAAEVVCAGDGVEAADILDLLTQLVDKSLVIVDAQGAEARYRLLETVRQYGHDRLLESEEAESARTRHCDFFLRLAESAEPELRGPGQRVWLDRLDKEYDNLWAALRWTKLEDSRAEAGLRFAGALWWFWYVGGHLTEGREWLEGVLSMHPGAFPSLRAKALQGAGRLAARQGDDARARLSYGESLVLCRELGDKLCVARSLQGMARVATHQGDYDKARSWAEEALAIFRDVGDKGGIAASLNELGEITRSLGDYEHARGLYEESLALQLEIGDKVPTVSLLQNLGYVALHQGSLSQAAALFEEGLTMSREVRDMLGIASCLGGLAGVSVAQGQLERAARMFGAAKAAHEASGLVPDPVDRAEIDRRVTAVRSMLSEPAFAAAWAEGLAMTVEQAIEYALAS